MFPTCSKRDLAGRNALSATDLTISPQGPGRGRLPPSSEAYSMQRVRAPPTTVGAAAWAPVVCSPRLGGETVQDPRRNRVRAQPHADRRSGMPARRSGALAACGGDEERQDENEPEGEFPVEVTSAKFPTASGSPRPPTSMLGVENTGDEPIPDLAVTIYTGDDEGRRLVLHPLRRSPASPTRTARSGSSRTSTRRSSPRRRAAELDAEPTAGAETAADRTPSPSARSRPATSIDDGLARDAGAAAAPTPSTTRSRPASTARPRRSPPTAARPRASSSSRSRPSRRRRRVTTRARSSRRVATSRVAYGRALRVQPVVRRALAARLAARSAARRLRREGRARASPARRSLDAPPTPERSRATGSPTGDGDGGVELDEIGELRRARLRRPAARASSATSTSSSRAGDHARRAATGRPEAFLDISDEVAPAARAGAALDGLRARLRAVGPLLRRLHRHRGRHPGRRVPALEAATRRRRPAQRPRAAARRPAATRTTTAACSCSAPTASLYIGLGDGGSAGDPERNGQDLGTLLGKILRIDPRRRTASPYSIPARQPVRRRRGARGPRSTPTACATPGASRSTARPATSGSATSARTSRRRSTSSARASGRRRELRLVGVRGRPSASTTTRRRPDTIPPVLTYGARRRLLGHRRLRRPRPGASRASTAATSTPTSAPGELRSFTADEPRDRDARRPRRSASRSRAELVRRGHPRPHLRGLARTARSTG